MAKIIYQPYEHNCHLELQELNVKVSGVVAECSCGTQYRSAIGPRNEIFWERTSRESVRETNAIML
jgi:hypothetical protein